VGVLELMKIDERRWWEMAMRDGESWGEMRRDDESLRFCVCDFSFGGWAWTEILENFVAGLRELMREDERWGEVMRVPENSWEFLRVEDFVVAAFVFEVRHGREFWRILKDFRGRIAGVD
jgi:hypothetical protein